MGCGGLHTCCKATLCCAASSANRPRYTALHCSQLLHGTTRPIAIMTQQRQHALAQLLSAPRLTSTHITSTLEEEGFYKFLPANTADRLCRHDQAVRKMTSWCLCYLWVYISEVAGASGVRLRYDICWRYRNIAAAVLLVLSLSSIISLTIVVHRNSNVCNGRHECEVQNSLTAAQNLSVCCTSNTATLRISPLSLSLII